MIWKQPFIKPLFCCFVKVSTVTSPPVVWLYARPKKLPIQLMSAADSGASRPPLPEHCSHSFRAFRPPRDRAKATLVLVISQNLSL